MNKRIEQVITTTLLIVVSTMLCGAKQVPTNAIEPILQHNIYTRFKVERLAQINQASVLESVPIEEVSEVEKGEPSRITPETQKDFDLMVRVVMSESGNQPYECKVAVAETIVNRVLSPNFADNINDVVYAPNAYSSANNGEPNNDCIYAVEQALQQVTYSDKMVYFRTGYYHKFAIDFVKLGNTYFSLEN